MTKRIYLDYAAATPVAPEAAEIVQKIVAEDFGNPSSSHLEGRKAKAHLQKARSAVAFSLHAQNDEIFFTSGGTEADFLAVTGMARAMKYKGNHLIASAIEHSAVMGALEQLEKEGFEATLLPVDADGLVDPGIFRKAIRRETVLASIMWANNEIGTIQPVAELAAIAKETGILFHSDAVQAFPYLDLDARRAPVDALSISSHKIYGPKGAGAIYLRAGTPFKPLARGAQERGIRPGTENTAAIAGFGKAVDILAGERDLEFKRVGALARKLTSGALTGIADAVLNGHPEKRLPNNVNVAFSGADGESLLIQLDMEGVACSLGSACSAGAVLPSHVILALGRSKEQALCSIRFTLGKYTNEEEIEHLLHILPKIVEKTRRLTHAA